MDDIIEILPKLKHNKATGPDRIATEVFIYGTPRLFAHLSIMFSWFLKFGVLPAKFTQSTIVPLVKDKCGDLSDVENYRAIMISNAITKVFEFVLFDKLVSSSYVDEYQFGFKAKHSTGLCTNVLKQTIDYYTERGSYVFCSFVDFSKAFVRVNYWKLFNKLLDVNAAYDVVNYCHSGTPTNLFLYAGRIHSLCHLASKMVPDKALFYHLFFLHATSVRYCLV